MASIYTIALISGVTGIVASQEVAYSLRVLVLGIGTSLSSTLAVCFLIVPKIIAHFYGTDSDIFGTGTTAGGATATGTAGAATAIRVQSKVNSPLGTSNSPLRPLKSETDPENGLAQRVKDLEKENEMLKEQLETALKQPVY
uniref:Uncharacterized protein n=1 Tax=Fibrocapsa japonica TaxID=94617 RepID=A0A7S2UX93_9STRA|mmetsp:Transcript_14544/g.21405  ORF Transcript_14544/g.21405 Transcript_14544/m.21405 type:complete len:142 (+) Transcript_14544:2-427(+)